jgi:ribosomal protein S18 acetylase RimI-like enzyme
MLHEDPETLIRHARPADARELQALQATIYADGRWFVGEEPPQAFLLSRRLQRLDSGDSLYLVAEYEGNLAGWLELNRLQPRRMRHVALLTIAVGAPWRRLGIGRALLRRSTGWAQDVKLHKITLNVRAGNSGAIALYESEGFVHEGREADQFTVEGGYEDNLVMALFLRG